MSQKKKNTTTRPQPQHDHNHNTNTTTTQTQPQHKHSATPLPQNDRLGSRMCTGCDPSNTAVLLAFTKHHTHTIPFVQLSSLVFVWPSAVEINLRFVFIILTIQSLYVRGNSGDAKETEIIESPERPNKQCPWSPQLIGTHSKSFVFRSNNYQLECRIQSVTHLVWEESFRGGLGTQAYLVKLVGDRAWEQKKRNWGWRSIQGYLDQWMTHHLNQTKTTNH